MSGTHEEMIEAKKRGIDMSAPIMAAIGHDVSSMLVRDDPIAMLFYLESMIYAISGLHAATCIKMGVPSEAIKLGTDKLARAVTKGAEGGYAAAREGD